MLQKTLLNIEGLGRELDPELDLWATAKPFLERWMSEQLGWRGWARTLREEAPHWGMLLPQLPRLLHKVLRDERLNKVEAGLTEMLALQRGRNRWLMAITLLLTLMLVGALI